MQVQNRPTEWSRAECIALQVAAATLATAAVITAIAATAVYFSRSGLPVEGAPTQMPTALATNSPQAMRIQAEATWTQLQNDPTSLSQLADYLATERDLELIDTAMWDSEAFWGMTRDEIIVEVYANPLRAPEGLIQEGLVERYADYIVMEPWRRAGLYGTRTNTLYGLHTQLKANGYSNQLLESAAQKMLASRGGNHLWHQPMETVDWEGLL